MSELMDRIHKIKGNTRIKNLEGFDWKIPNFDVEKLSLFMELEKEDDHAKVVAAAHDLLFEIYALNFPEETKADVEIAIKQTPIVFLYKLIKEATNANDA